ncbi:cytoplasmic 60S subunit biogenesis factor ZNF622-like [Littorina saxatilis]|uniref:C2H2-type domain-containing protein n=1 Tax=Littorina saxatilis TaxID=31220 RepID=A0AAN9BPG1_9CAEN
MEEFRGLTCLTCRVAFADIDKGREHYKSDWHRYNLKRKVAQMDPLSADIYKNQVASKHEKASAQEELEGSFCRLCNKPFRSQNALESHMRSKKHREMESVSKKFGIDQSKIVTRSNGSTKTSESEPAQMEVESEGEEGSDVESWDGNELGLEECLFCSHISSSLETNFTHMTTKHGFFLPDAEFVCDLEGLVVYLGEMISQGHMCLWCNQRSKLFRSVRDVQRHMVDKGHCKMKHDETNRHEYADFYDYRSSYPDADQPEGGEEAESIDPEMLVSSGFELVLPSGWSIGHRSLASYYKQNHGRRQVAKRTALSKVLAGYRALGWSGTTDAAVKQRAKDVHYLQRMKNKFRMKVETRANKMQFHYRDQNPI